MNPMNELNDYLKAFSSLHTARIKGRRAPHKAVLLLAIIELVERAEITSPRIELTDALCHKFTVLWKSLPRGGYSIKAMRQAFAYAEVDDLLFQLLQNAEARAALKNVLLHEYF